MKHFITMWVLLFLCATLGAGFSALDRLDLVLPLFGGSCLVAAVLAKLLPHIE